MIQKSSDDGHHRHDCGRSPVQFVELALSPRSVAIDGSHPVGDGVAIDPVECGVSVVLTFVADVAAVEADFVALLLLACQTYRHASD